MSTLLSRITIDPNICHGKPVESLLEYRTGGDPIQDLVENFPDLHDVPACIDLAAQPIKLKSHHPELA